MSGGAPRNAVPVVLFAHARPATLVRTLECLRRDAVPRIIAFSDGPRTSDQAHAVRAVRSLLRAVDWCELELVERAENLGLGRSILTGMSEVFGRHPAALVFEDDLVCVPGTYRYLSEALRAYGDDPRVLSVTGWTHPSVTPASAGGRPYFDGRADSLVWGAWARSWREMGRPAMELVAACRAGGLDIARYGSDLPETAKVEAELNVWAVRFLYAHIYRRGLCLRPPHSLVNHIGVGPDASNAAGDTRWSNTGLGVCPPIPDSWPEPIENPECPGLWQRAYPPPQAPRPLWRRLPAGIGRRLLSATRRVFGGATGRDETW